MDSDKTLVEGEKRKENIVYEWDYYEAHKKTADANPTGAVCEFLKKAGYFRFCETFMKQIPKYIHPKNKAAYERLLKLCDDRAKQLGGRIYAIVDYENWEARIELTLPFVEFSEDGEHAFLQYAAQHTSYICFAPSVDGQSIVMKMYVDYFEDVPLGLLDEATLRRVDERACEQALKALDHNDFE